MLRIHQHNLKPKQKNYLLPSATHSKQAGSVPTKLILKGLDITQFPHLDNLTILACEFRSSHPRHLTPRRGEPEQRPGMPPRETHPTERLAPLHDHGMDFAVIIVQRVADRRDHPSKAVVADAVHSDGTVEAQRFAADLGDEVQVAPVPNVGNEFLHQFPCYCVPVGVLFQVGEGIWC